MKEGSVLLQFRTSIIFMSSQQRGLVRIVTLSGNKHHHGLSTGAILRCNHSLTRNPRARLDTVYRKTTAAMAMKAVVCERSAVVECEVHVCGDVV